MGALQQLYSEEEVVSRYDTAWKHSKVEHSSYKRISLENFSPWQGEKTMENWVTANKAIKNWQIFVFFFQGTREEGEKKSEGKIPYKNEFHMLKRSFI